MARKASNKAQEPLAFEQAMAELEGLAEQMEQGELTLEQALDHFERGIALTRRCRQSLDAAQQKVQILLEQDAEAELHPYTESETPPQEPDA